MGLAFFAYAPKNVVAITEAELSPVETTTPDEVIEFKVAENYFSDILNAQLVIFAVIVGAAWFMNWVSSRREIKNTVKDGVGELETQFKRSFDEWKGAFTQKINERFEETNLENSLTRGEVYRNMAQFWDSKERFVIAFIWWMRAASTVFSAGDDDMTRICLSGAKKSISRAESIAGLKPEDIGEFQKLIGEIDDTKFKIEKELLNEVLKAKLKEEIPHA